MARAGDVRAIGATVVMSIAGALGAWGIVASQEGCALKTCDPSWVPDFTKNESAPLGHQLDPDTWESVGMFDEWTYFPGQRTLGFDLGLMLNHPPNRKVIEILPYVSPNPRPTDPGANFALGAGNIAEVAGVPNEPSSDPDAGASTLLFLRNDSCATYYLRVVVRLGPEEGGGTDAGDASDSSSSDAGDASSTLDGGEAGPPAADAGANQEQ